MLAALASAAVPGIAVAGARDSEHDNATDTGMGIDQAVVQDATGRVYDVYASDTEAGKRRLAGRVRAARTLAEARSPAGWASRWTTCWPSRTVGTQGAPPPVRR